MSSGRKWAYIAFMGTLTCTTISACYWQSSRWEKVREELSKTNPQELNQYDNVQEIYPFKYLAVKGTLSRQYQRIQRMRDGRMGYLVVRSLKYRSGKGDLREIAALEGWCQQEFEYEPKQAIQDEKLFKGILRQKEKKDYVHEKFKKQDLEKFNMNTYINLEQILPKLKIAPQPINQQYYLQILRPLQSTDHASFPYQYSIDNFELPYLTPDKHLSYASFWGFCTIIGLSSIIKVLRFR